MSGVAFLNRCVSPTHTHGWFARLREWLGRRRRTQRTSCSYRRLVLEMLEDRNAPNGLGGSPPFAADDWFDLLHGTTLFGNLLSNDYDPDGDLLSLSRFSINGQDYSPGQQITITQDDQTVGYLTVNADGSFQFVPSLRYKGPLSFSYTIFDGEHESTAWVYINVYNNPPEVSDGSFEVLHDSDLSGNLLSFGWDLDGDALSIVAINGTPIEHDGPYYFGQPISLPSGATLTVFADGTFSYAPPPNYTGSDSFTFTLSDGLDTTSATINIFLYNNADDASSNTNGGSSSATTNNSPPDIGNIEILNLSRPGQNPRTKDTLLLVVNNITDTDGDPVTLTISWQVTRVDGTTATLIKEVPIGSATSASDLYDLSLPGMGDVGDVIRLTVIASDGQGSSAPQYRDLVVENTPPVVTDADIVVEGYQSVDEGIYYFLVGQQARIHVRAQDDDMDVGQGNDELRLEIGGEMPPTEAGWIYHDYTDGEFLVEGIIADHGDPYEATKVYTLNICVKDRYGEGDPPVLVAVTGPRKVTANVDLPPGTHLPGSGTASDPWLLRSGTSACFRLYIHGVGFAHGFMPGPMRRAPGLLPTQDVFFRLYEDDLLVDDVLIRDTPTTLTIWSTPAGDWVATSLFTLEARPDGRIYGPHGHTGGACEGRGKELYFRFSWWGPHGTSRYEKVVTGLFYVKWVS